MNMVGVCVRVAHVLGCMSFLSEVAGCDRVCIKCMDLHLLTYVCVHVCGYMNLHMCACVNVFGVYAHMHMHVQECMYMCV